MKTEKGRRAILTQAGVPIGCKKLVGGRARLHGIRHLVLFDRKSSRTEQIPNLNHTFCPMITGIYIYIYSLYC